MGVGRDRAERELNQPSEVRPLPLPDLVTLRCHTQPLGLSYPIYWGESRILPWPPVRDVERLTQVDGRENALWLFHGHVLVSP